MKRKGIFSIIVVALLVAITVSPSSAQLALQPKTLTTLTTRTTSDTSAGLVIQVENEVKTIICYQRVDTLTGNGQLKVILQGSHNGSTWYDVDSLSTVVAAGNKRKVITWPDPYLRAVNVIGGTTRCRNSLILAGKQ